MLKKTSVLVTQDGESHPALLTFWHWCWEHTRCYAAKTLMYIVRSFKEKGRNGSETAKTS